MRYGYGARLFWGEPSLLGLSLLGSTLGTGPVIALLRVIAAFVAVAILGIVARLMWLLPSAVDAAVAFTIAVAWALWLHKQEHQ